MKLHLTKKTSYFFIILFLCGLSRLSAQVSGDYRTVGSGDWAAFATVWEKYDGAMWAVATAVPGSTNNVTIRTGHDVTFTALASCKNLTIETGASLKGSSTFRVYGATLRVDGTLGINTGANAMILEPSIPAADGTSMTITGSGAEVVVNRLRPNVTGLTIVIDINMFTNPVTGAAGVGANGKDNTTFTINAGKTVRTAPLAYVSGGASGSNDPGTSAIWTINVNGTLNVGTDNNSAGLGTATTNFNLRGGAGKSATLNVGSAGVVNIAGSLLAPDGTTSNTATAGTATVNVSAGGLINFVGFGSTPTGTGQCDISKATTTIAGTVDFGACSPGTNRSLGTATVTGRLRLKDSGFPVGATTLSAGSTVEYYGATKLSSTQATYQNLEINSSAGNDTLTTAVTVNGTMTMTIGKLFLGNYDLTLNSSLVGASGSNKYFVTNGTGSLIRNNIVIPTLFQIGVSETSYDPFGVVPSGSSSFKARVSETITNPVSNPTLIVQREWTIDRTAGSGSVTMTLQHDASAPLNSFNGANPVAVAHWTGAAYENLTASYSSNTFALASVSSFGNAFVGGNTASIPVEMTVFKAYAKGAVNILDWSTATERNNREFVIERSVNGHDYQTIGAVKGYGNSNIVQNYSFTDDAAPLSVAYYRLRQIDFDGKETTSKAVTVARSGNTKAGLDKLYPSVTSDVLTLEMTTNGNTTLTIIDLLGRVVSTKQLGDNTGFLIQRLDVSSLNNGLYFINIQSGNSHITEKFEKQ